MTTRTDIRISATLLLVGGPTLVIDTAGLRIVTDPTFDAPGPHPVGERILTKLDAPAVAPGTLGRVDLVLLSHDQHPDNLDTTGRAVVAGARRTLSTAQAAQRMPGVEGLAPWQAVEVATPDGTMTVTAVPALHGPPGAEVYSGPVTGFVLEPPGQDRIYVSGDNASVDVVEQIADRFPEIGLAVLFCGAARRADAPAALTLTAEDAVRAAQVLRPVAVVPVHADGWLHFTESVGTVHHAFTAAGLADELLVLSAGVPHSIGAAT